MATTKATTKATKTTKQQTALARLTCHVCGNLSGGTAWWWDTRLWVGSANGPVCPVCVRAEATAHAE